MDFVTEASNSGPSETLTFTVCVPAVTALVWTTSFLPSPVSSTPSTYHVNVSGFSSGSVDSEAFMMIEVPELASARLKTASGLRFWLRR